MSTTIRLAELRDIEGITAIYNEAVVNTTATFDTDQKSIAEQTAWFHEHERPYELLAAELDGGVVGFACLSRYSGRCAYSRTAEISVYVTPDCHKQGIGSQLIEHLLTRGKANGICTVLARIAEGNDHSVRMHERFGFELIGTMKQVGEKFNRVLDVHLMQAILAPADKRQ